MKATHSRAAKGGQVGANGEWYEGGKFINTIPENEKRAAKKQKKATRKQEIEPYVWEVAPEGKYSIFRYLSGMEWFRQETMQFTFNADLRSDYATPEAVAKRKAAIAAFNRGERWS